MLGRNRRGVLSADEPVVAQGMGYLQGLAAAQVAGAHLVLATARRILIVNERPRPSRSRLTERDIFHELPWHSISGCWHGSVAPPPATRLVDLTAREAFVLHLKTSDPTDYPDLVVFPYDSDTWSEILRAAGISVTNDLG